MSEFRGKKQDRHELTCSEVTGIYTTQSTLAEINEACKWHFITLPTSHQCGNILVCPKLWEQQCRCGGEGGGWSYIKNHQMAEDTSQQILFMHHD